MIRFGADAWDAIQTLYDDPARPVLADRVEAMLDVLDEDPGDPEGVPYIHFAGPGLA